MDFSFSPELQALSDEARRVARETTSTLDVTEDSWLRGVDADFPQILASHGWLGMCLPTEWGGGGRPAIERFAVVEALISEGAPIATAWFADRQIGPTLLQLGTEELMRVVSLDLRAALAED